MIPLEPLELKQQKRLAFTWSITFLVLFPLLIILGLAMCISQATLMKLLLANFYAFMTLHGLGMAGVLFSFAFAAIWYIISTRFARLNTRVGYFIYITVLIGVTGLTIGTLVGKFAPGWYMLYPLPLNVATWDSWTIGISIISLIILGIAWLVGILHVLNALSKEYGGITNLLGWKYLRKREGRKELPPIVLITAISFLTGVVAFLAGTVMLTMYLMQLFKPTISFDTLLLKNMTFFFGNTLMNITLYCGVGWVYALLPEFTGREWKTNKLLVYSWNATFFFILFSYFHHLYMDFVQPLPMQYAGQLASYLSAIPATVVTMFGVILQLYHSKIKWGIIPLMFLIGMAGWAIGGFTAVVDSTIAINKVLHNTMWVPAQFHTSALLGFVLFIFAFLFYLFSGKENQHGGKLAKTGFWLFVTGGYGFVLMYYLGGLNGIPRAYARYSGIQIKSMHSLAIVLAETSVFFIILLLIGLFIMYFSLFKNFLNQKTAPNFSNIVVH